MNDDQMRSAFEHWFSDGGESPNAVARDNNGEYRLMQASFAWTVWQAAWRAGRNDLAHELADASTQDARDAATLPRVQSFPLTEEQERFLNGGGVSPSPAPQREVPPGKWKVDMPDGTYGRMPGDPPGPASVCAVIGGYVYDVQPRTGMLIASAPPTGYRLQKFNEEMQVGPRPWEIPGPHQPNPPLPRDLDPTVPRGEGNSTPGVQEVDRV